MARNSTDLKYVKGIGDLSAVLRGLPEDMRSKILVRGVERAIAPILISAKRYAKRSERTGALRASLTTKVVNYPRDGRAVGLVGPERAYYRNGKKTGKLGSLFGAADRPANYAHLIEYGHHAVAPIKGTSRRKKTALPTKNGRTWVAAKPFIRPALATTTAEQGEGFFQGIAVGVETTRRRLVESGAHSV